MCKKFQPVHNKEKEALFSRGRTWEGIWAGLRERKGKKNLSIFKLKIKIKNISNILFLFTICTCLIKNIHRNAHIAFVWKHVI